MCATPICFRTACWEGKRQGLGAAGRVVAKAGRRRAEVDAEQAVRAAVDPDGELDYREFIDNTFGSKNENIDEYIEAFARGAREFFVEIRDKL
jgi:hypothetical protein